MKKASDGKLPESQEKKTVVKAAAAKTAKTAVKAAAAKKIGRASCRERV